MPISAATIAATVTAVGRSPGASGVERGADRVGALARAGVAALRSCSSARRRDAVRSGSRGAYGCAAPTGTSSAARRLGRRALRVGRLGDRPHDDARRAPRSTAAGSVAGVEPADREPRLADVRGGVARRSRGPPRGAPAWSAWRAPGRRRGSPRRGRRPPRRPARARASSGRRSASGPTSRAGRGGRAVVLPDVHAVGGARVDEVGPVVEDEQRAVRVGGGAERARRRDQPVVVERLVAQLHDVDAAAQRGVEERAAGARRRRGRGGRSARRSRGVIGASRGMRYHERRIREPADRAERAARGPPTVEPDPGRAGVGKEWQWQSQSEQPDVAVVGGGPIGLACAWRAAQRGLRVLVLDAGEPGAWHVAAGMLAPVAEAEFGEEALLELGLRARGRLRRLLRRARGASGRSRPRATGTLVVARDRDEAEELERLLELRRALGLAVERPAPERGAPRGAGAGADRAPRARRPRRPLRRSAPARRRAGRARSRAPAASPPHARVTAVSRRGDASPASSWTRRRAAIAVVAPPAWSSAGAGRGRARRACRCGRSRARCCGCATRTAPAWSSARSARRDAYLVPRADGRYVLGATMEERGFDTAPTAGGVLELLRDLVRGRARRARARDRGAARRPAARDARQPARHRPGRARRARLGDRPLPQRDPARRPSPASWSPPRCAARRRPMGGAAPTPRASRRCRHEGRGQRRADASSAPARRCGAARRARRCPAAAAASPWRSTPRSCRAASGRRRARRRRAGRGPARDPGRLRHGRHRTHADDPLDDRAAASCARGCCSARAASARSRRWRPRSRRAAPSSSPSRCGASTRARAARSSTCSTRAGVQLLPNTAGCFTARDAVADRASSPARRSRPTGSSSR